jgi:hypothetical protein
LAWAGLRPIGGDPALGIAGFSAEVPGHGSAAAGGATPIATTSPIATADTSDTDAIRGIADM